MKTVTVEIKKDYAIRILEDLEKTKIIRLIPQKTNGRKKLSAKLRGAISKSSAKKLQKQIQNVRAEWERII